MCMLSSHNPFSLSIIYLIPSYNASITSTDLTPILFIVAMSYTSAPSPAYLICS